MTIPFATALTGPPQPSNSTGQFQKLQTFYAQEFAALLTRMSNAPVCAGTLLDRSVVVWISESGQGEDHRGYFMPVVIAGGADSGIDVGRTIEIVPHPVPIENLLAVVRTQGDLFAALGRLWGLPPTFGDPRIARQPLTEILLP